MYALMALGITLTMTVIKLPNFAHAEFITVGAFTALIASQSISTNPAIILGLAFIVAAIVALLSHQLVFKSLEKQNATFYTLLLASFAVGLVIRYVLFIIADQFELFDKRIQIPLEIVYRSDSVIITNIFMWVVPTSIILVLVLSLLLNYTAMGREMRALANNLILARVIGIQVGRVTNHPPDDRLVGPSLSPGTGFSKPEPCRERPDVPEAGTIGAARAGVPSRSCWKLRVA
jgi:branched-subunit amino acid ABC-type transport system permease component